MAGRGRGRGRGLTLSFNLEALGVQRAELFGSVNQPPPPLFPPLPRIPVPDTSYEPSDLKLLEIRREMRAKHRQRSTLLTIEEKKRDIERYSDKYQLNQQEDEAWTPDWSQFPNELRPERPKKRKKVTVAPNLKAARTSKPQDKADILARAKDRLRAESAEGVVRELEEEENKKDEEDDDEDEAKEEEEEEEEDLDEEEETDYNLTYFDNGEGYGDDDDEDDEPAYS